MYPRRHFRGRDPYVALLFAQLGHRVLQLEHKPPVTLALVAVNVLLHFGASDILPPKVFVAIRGICLQPRLILERGHLRRLVVPAFLHADDMHLYYNMSSLLWKGVQLEPIYGHTMFAALVAELLLLSHGITVLLAALLAACIPAYGYLYRSTCAVGFSAVLFALKVVLAHNSPGRGEIMGFTVPTKYLCWVELLLASFLNPGASFLGHLGGILAGLLHVRMLEPMLRAIPAAMDGRQPPGGRGRGNFGGGSQRQYFSSGGRLGGHRDSNGGSGAGAGSGAGGSAGGGSGAGPSGSPHAGPWAAAPGTGSRGGRGSGSHIGAGSIGAGPHPSRRIPEARKTAAGRQPAAAGGAGAAQGGLDDDNGNGAAAPSRRSTPTPSQASPVGPAGPAAGNSDGKQGDNAGPASGHVELLDPEPLTVAELRRRRLQRFH